jgi:hypothetical protein
LEIFSTDIARQKSGRFTVPAVYYHRGLEAALTVSPLYYQSEALPLFPGRNRVLHCHGAAIFATMMALPITSPGRLRSLESRAIAFLPGSLGNLFQLVCKIVRYEIAGIQKAFHAQKHLNGLRVVALRCKLLCSRDYRVLLPLPVQRHAASPLNTPRRT